jgi:hypothetical protein
MEEYKSPLTPEQRKELIEKILKGLRNDPRYKAHNEFIDGICTNKS